MCQAAATEIFETAAIVLKNSVSFFSVCPSERCFAHARYCYLREFNLEKGGIVLQDSWTELEEDCVLI